MRLLEIAGQADRFDLTVVSNQADGTVAFGEASLSRRRPAQTPGQTVGRSFAGDGHMLFSDRFVDLPAEGGVVVSNPFSMRAPQAFSIRLSIGTLQGTRATIQPTGWGEIVLADLAELADALVGTGVAIGRTWQTARATYLLTARTRADID